MNHSFPKLNACFKTICVKNPFTMKDMKYYSVLNAFTMKDTKYYSVLNAISIKFNADREGVAVSTVSVSCITSSL